MSKTHHQIRKVSINYHEIIVNKCKITTMIHLKEVHGTVKFCRMGFDLIMEAMEVTAELKAET